MRLLPWPRRGVSHALPDPHQAGMQRSHSGLSTATGDRVASGLSETLPPPTGDSRGAAGGVGRGVGLLSSHSWATVSLPAPWTREPGGAEGGRRSASDGRLGGGSVHRSGSGSRSDGIPSVEALVAYADGLGPEERRAALSVPVHKVWGWCEH